MAVFDNDEQKEKSVCRPRKPDLSLSRQFVAMFVAQEKKNETWKPDLCLCRDTGGQPSLKRDIDGHLSLSIETYTDGQLLPL